MLYFVGSGRFRAKSSHQRGLEDGGDGGSNSVKTGSNPIRGQFQNPVRDLCGSPLPFHNKSFVLVIDWSF